MQKCTSESPKYTNYMHENAKYANIPNYACKKWGKTTIKAHKSGRQQAHETNVSFLIFFFKKGQ